MRLEATVDKEKHDENILDIVFRRKKITTIRTALQDQFRHVKSPTTVRVRDWERTLSLVSQARSTRPMGEADCFTFRANLRYLNHVPHADNTTRKVMAETPCFVKFAWKTLTQSFGASAERHIVGKDIERLLQRGLSPCLPFAINELTISNDEGLASWELYRNLLKEYGNKRRTGGKKSRPVHLLVMESCGDVSLKKYILSKASSGNDIVPIFLMIFHALEVLADAGISHNDLHLENIVVKRIPSTVVSFGGKVFRTSAVPVIVDWDLGCSVQRRNKSLRYYEYVGIFNSHNRLFDLFGVVKSFFYSCDNSHAAHEDTIARHEETRTLISTLKAVFKPVIDKHPWLFRYWFHDRVSNQRVPTVQQTPYFSPHVKNGDPVELWPVEVTTATPTHAELQTILHGIIEKTKGVVTELPEFSFT